MTERNYTVDQLFDRCMDIQDMIETERPEIARNNLWKNKDNFWSGEHLDAADSPTFESKVEEMRKYPHQDNHMD